MSDSSLASINALCGTFIAVTTVVVALRLIARRKHGLSYLADDWCMLIAYLAFIASSACAFVLGSIGWIGYGKYPYSSQDELRHRFDQAYKIIQGQDTTFLLTLCFTKLSALFFYRRIWCSGINKPMLNAMIIATIVLIACWGITFEFLAIFQCQGHSANLWNPTIYDKWCTISLPYVYGFYVSDVVLDVWVLAIPIPNAYLPLYTAFDIKADTRQILALRMSTTKKLSTVGVFLLAFLGFGASIARLVNLLRIEILGYDNIVATLPEAPESKFVFYQILEQGATIIAINLPTIWGLFPKYGPEVLMKAARSIRSMGSRSGGSRTSGHQRPNTINQSVVFLGDDGTHESYAMHGISMPPAPPVLQENIHVKRDVNVTTSDAV